MASGAMADFARLPAEKKALIFVVIGGIGGLLYYQFSFKSLRENLEIAEATNAASAAMNSKLAADLPKYEELKADMKRLTAAIQENAKALPSEAEVPAFFETLERKVRESGVEIIKWRKLPEESVETFVRVPVDIELSGSYMQLKRFFASLVQKGVSPALDGGVEERERVVSIENLSLTNPVVKNREIAVKANFTAVTFRQEDPAEGAAPRPQIRSGGGGAPQPSGGAPPLPSAGTPQGAKARTDTAIEKGDARTTTGAGAAAPKGGN